MGGPVSEAAGAADPFDDLIESQGVLLSCGHSGLVTSELTRGFINDGVVFEAGEDDSGACVCSGGCFDFGDESPGLLSASVPIGGFEAFFELVAGGGPHQPLLLAAGRPGRCRIVLLRPWRRTGPVRGRRIPGVRYWHRGKLRWSDALRDGQIQVTGKATARPLASGLEPPYTPNPADLTGPTVRAESMWVPAQVTSRPRSAKRVNSGRKVIRTVPVDPARCLATITSARPLVSWSSGW